MSIEIKDGMVTLSVEQYDRLVEASLFLDCLRNAGVDNWCGYGDAQAMYHGQDDE